MCNFLFSKSLILLYLLLINIFSTHVITAIASSEVEMDKGVRYKKPTPIDRDKENFSSQKESCASEKHEKRKFDSEALYSQKQNSTSQKKDAASTFFKKSKGRPKVIFHEEDQQLLSLREGILSLKETIEKSYLYASFLYLEKAYHDFEKLDYLPLHWERIADELKAFKWPAQKTAKERVGGQLFFPASHIHKWLETHRTEHLIHRLDIIWSNVFAYKFKHSLAGFYVLKSLQENYSMIGPQYSPFYTNLYSSIFEDLKQTLDHPDVCYALGREYSIYPYFVRNYISENDIKLHKRGKDLKNKFEILVLKSLYVKYSSCRPTEEEFLELASQGYAPAYIRAASMAEERSDLEKAAELLNKALQTGHEEASLSLVRVYKKQHYEDKAQEASKANIASSYLSKGVKLVGPVELNYSFLKTEKLKKIPLKIIKQAENYFIKAGKARDPKGFRYLGALNLKLSEIAKTEEEKISLKSRALLAFRDGCRIGDICCLAEMRRLTSKKHFAEIIKASKLEPYEDFLGYMEQFLSE
ncbi:MAG: hypothetical protein IBJ00_06215 [Alphaproteobacteria bacterium]|nr:hypothetical protein [Alphaproteobacteria bacterium]